MHLINICTINSNYARKRDEKLNRIPQSHRKTFPEEVSVYLNNVFSPLREKALKVGELEGSMRPYLGRLKDSLTNTKGQSPTKQTLIAEFLINTLIRKYEHYTWDALSKLNPKPFRFFYDVYSGLTYTTGTIVLTEIEIRGQSDRLFNEFLDDMSKANKTQSTVQDVEQYLRFKEASRLAGELIMRDPTGFALVDYLANTDNLPLKSNENGCPEYVKAGKLLAGDLYKIIYPMTSHLYPL